MTSAIPTRVGGRHPAHCTAVGKAILAASADDVLTPFKPIYSPQDELLDLDNGPVAGRTEQRFAPMVPRSTVRVAGGLRVRCGRDRRSRRSGRGGVGVRTDEPDDVRSAPRLARPNGGVGNLASDPGGRWTSGTDVATDATVADGPDGPRVRHGTGAGRSAVRVTLDPDIQAVIDALNSGFPKVATMTGAEVRAAIVARRRPADNIEKVGGVTDRTVDGPAGDIAVRIYRPLAESPSPVPRVFAHGGGFVFAISTAMMRCVGRWPTGWAQWWWRLTTGWHRNIAGLRPQGHVCGHRMGGAQRIDTRSGPGPSSRRR